MHASKHIRRWRNWEKNKKNAAGQVTRNFKSLTEDETAWKEATKGRKELCSRVAVTTGAGFECVNTKPCSWLPQLSRLGGGAVLFLGRV